MSKVKPKEYHVFAAVPAQTIADLMVSIVESQASALWTTNIEYAKGFVAAVPSEPWYSRAKYFESAFEFRVFDLENSKWYCVGSKEVRDGLELMLRKSPHRFANILSDEIGSWDTVDADCFFQYVVHGELVYC